MNWTYYNYRSQKIYRRIIRTVCSRFYFETNHNPKNSVLLAGTGRSGTSWLADILTSHYPSRLMFEPFHSKKVPEFAKFHLFQYMNPNHQDYDLHAYAYKVVSGNIHHPWINWQNEHLLPRFRVIKEIRANLFLKWFHNAFPYIPIIFIIRHPCAVVLSRMELGWATDSDIEPFLQQERLIADHLADKIDLIRCAQTDEEKHAIIWCISNLVPLRQFQPGEIKIVFYEDLCNQPKKELQGIFSTIGQEYTPLTETALRRPSPTSWKKSAVVTGEDKLSRWTKTLSVRQIENVQRIVREFNLDHLYGDSLVPNGAGE